MGGHKGGPYIGFDDYYDILSFLTLHCHYFTNGF